VKKLNRRLLTVIGTTAAVLGVASAAFAASADVTLPVSGSVTTKGSRPPKAPQVNPVQWEPSRGTFTSFMSATDMTCGAHFDPENDQALIVEVSGYIGEECIINAPISLADGVDKYSVTADARVEGALLNVSVLYAAFQPTVQLDITVQDADATIGPITLHVAQ
jgi:hypothetical protein